MIDYILAFPTEADAIADPVVGAYYVPASAMSPVGQWRGDCVIPNIEIYTQTGTQSITQPDGSTQTVPVNTPIDGKFRLVIALRHRDAALDAHPLLAIVADRDAAEAGASVAQFVLWCNVPVAALQGLFVSPTFAGSNYPFGAAA